MSISTPVVADGISPQGIRLATLSLNSPYGLLAKIMTYCRIHQPDLRRVT